MILNSQGDPRSETEVSFNKKQFVFKCPARNITALIQGRTLMAYDNFVLYSIICIKLEELKKKKKKKNLRDSWANSWPILRVRLHINYNHQEVISVWSYQQLIHFTFHFTACYGAAHEDTVYYAAALCHRCCYRWRNKYQFSCWADFPFWLPWDWNQNRKILLRVFI